MSTGGMFRGSMVALVTPMQVDGSVDYQSLANLVEFHIENNTSAIISMGTTGESATLNMDEHCEVMSRTVEMVTGRIPVIAGTGANSTWEAIELTKGANQGGADAFHIQTHDDSEVLQRTGRHVSGVWIVRRRDRRDVAFHQAGRHGQHLGVVVEAEAGHVARKQRLAVDL